MTDDQDPRKAFYDETKIDEPVEIKGGELHYQTDRLEHFLRGHPESGIYQRGGVLVEISKIPARTKEEKEREVIKREDDSVVISQVTSPRLRELGCRFGRWQRYDKRSEAMKNVDCPREVSETLANRTSWDLPVLISVLGAPTISRSGNIINKKGYDKRTGVFLHIDDWKTIKESPTREDAIAARELLEDLVDEFPFIDDAARAAWLSALLTALIRWTLRTAPFFGFDAPVMGSGKTLLATLIGILISGREPPTMNKAKDEAEFKKGLLAALMAGDPLLLIDNIEHQIAGEVLCSIATSEQYRDRLLGKTQLVTVSTGVTVMLNGNNLVIRGDLSTRLLMSRLDPRTEHPEERTFKVKDIREHAIARRQELVNAALTILLAYEQAGRPPVDVKPFGRFEDWSDRVRVPLIWAGSADPCETRLRVESSDPERESHGAFLAAWWEMYGEKEVLTKNMIHDVTTGTDDSEIASDLKEAILSVAGDGNKINSRRLGRKIGSWEGRIQGGLRIIKGREIHRVRAWRLERLGGNGSTGNTGITGFSTNKIENSQTNSGDGQTETRETSQTRTEENTMSVLREKIKPALQELDLTEDQFIKELSADDISDIVSGDMPEKDIRTWAEHFNNKLKG